MKKKYFFIQITFLFIALLIPIYKTGSNDIFYSCNGPELSKTYPKNRNNEAVNNSNNISDSELKEKTKLGWNLIWNDEFNNDIINDKYWTLQNGVGIWGNNELQYYTNRIENCYITDGKLIIRGLKENYENYHYTSGRIVTKGKFDFLYGKIEIKAKFPEGNGLLPAIWLLPCEDNYDSRIKNGEIDLAEMLGNNPKFIYGVAHYYSKKATRSYEKYSSGTTDFSKEFHIYSIEWDSQQIKWMIDDKVYFTFNLKNTFNEKYDPFNKKFYLIINLAIGGDWPGNDLSQTTFPSLFEIDYVRYYRLNSN